MGIDEAKEKTGELVSQSIEGQKPNFKNALSRFVADKLRPQIPTVTPEPVFEEPAYAIPVVEEVLPPEPLTPEQELKEKSRKAIEDLKRLNIESMESGNSRIGYAIGSEDGEFFILSNPVDVVAGNKRNNGDEVRVLHRNYVVFTTSGPRVILLNKGPIDDQGEIKPREIGGGTEDYYWGNGEDQLLFALQAHNKEWEEPNGHRIPFKIIPPHSLKSEETKYEYHFAGNGFSRNKDGEYLIISSNGGHYSIKAGGGNNTLSSDISPDLVSEAYDKSIEASGSKREPLPPTEIEKQINALDLLQGKIGSR